MTNPLWVAGLAVVLAACSGPYSNPAVAANNGSVPVAVRVETAELRNIPEMISATGELLAEDQATIGVKVAGRISRMSVDLGSRVEAGEVIAELEKEDYEFQVRQAEAQVEQTRARLGLGPKDGDEVDPVKTSIVRQAAASLREARLLHGNSTKLFEQGVVSNVDFQRAGVALQAAEARYQASIEEIYRSRAELVQRRAELSLARQHLADTYIRAPFRGAITRRIATLGEYLAVNAPVAVLVRWHPLRIRLEVPERLAGKVRAGQRIDLKLEAGGAVQPGRVIRLSPSIEAQNRSLVVEGEIPNEQGILRAGSFVQGLITVDPNARGFAVPLKSILAFAGVERVLVVESGVLAERLIRRGRMLSDESIEIASGLKAGDRVVLEPSDRLSVGQKVNIEER